MLLQSDPFRDFENLFRTLGRTDTDNRMAMDAYRRGEDVWVHLDLPGVSPEAIDIDEQGQIVGLF